MWDARAHPCSSGMLLDPLSSAASEEVLNDPDKRTIREFIAEAVARMLQNFQPIGKDAELVMLVEGYSDLLRRLLKPRDQEYDENCHGTICDSLSTVHKRCSIGSASRVLSCVEEALLACSRATAHGLSRAGSLALSRLLLTK